MVFGDSISAGYGLKLDEGWVHLLQNRISAAGLRYNVINASVTGETTGGGKRRLQKTLKKHDPQIVIIELGGNDGLRGLNLNSMYENLKTMVDFCLKNDRKVILAGIQLPPNYGSAYTQQFTETFRKVALEKSVLLVPQMFNGFATKLNYFQADQIHPNKNAQIIMLDNIWSSLSPLLQGKI